MYLTIDHKRVFSAVATGWRRLAAVAMMLSAGCVLAANSNLTWNVDLALKETYDGNVYLQDIAPLPANVAAAEAAGLNAVPAKYSSFITTIIPRFGAGYKPGAAFDVVAGYAPEIALYTSAEEEDYIAHRVTLNFGGKIKDATWELLNAPTFVEGGTIGPTFGRPGDSAGEQMVRPPRRILLLPRLPDRSAVEPGGYGQRVCIRELYRPE
jgi:hypothetical protein